MLPATSSSAEQLCILLASFASLQVILHFIAAMKCCRDTLM